MTAPTPDPAQLCRHGNQCWPRHEFSPRGVCARCGAVLPRVAKPGAERKECSE